MAVQSSLAVSLSRLLNSLGWTTEADRFTLRATEPAFEPVTRTWMVGKASAISDEEVRRVGPSRIIVEDFATASQMSRLLGLLPQASGDEIPVSTYSRFVDRLWGADVAVRRALADAEAGDSDGLFGETMPLNARHITQHVDFGDISVRDHRALEHGLASAGVWLAILSDAGLGKTEFLRLHEYRFAQLYESAQRGASYIELPPIALRVSLRDFRSLSLDYIAHALSQPAQRGHARVPLPRISSGAVLRELLVQGRLILFLDGLDEVIADSSSIEAGLQEWHRAVSAGARIVVASRTGHASARGAIARRFKPDETAAMKPLEKATALELLERRNASSQRASSIYAALSGPAATIPLYLVLANYVGLDETLPDDVRVSKTLVLQTLVTHFCEREVSRLGVDSSTQMDLLDQVSEWITLDSMLSRDELLQALGLDSADARARVVLNPHALLLHNESGGVEFKFPEFGALFGARVLASSWRSRGFDSVKQVLRTKRLDELVIEYLARLIHSSTISGAWVESALDADRGLLLRRNLLAVALAKVNDTSSGLSPNARAVELATVLGNRYLANVSLAGLSIERFDFTGWEIKRVQGHEGVFSYCENLSRSDHDESVTTVLLEGCSFSDPAVVEVDLSSAVDSLVRLIKPLRRKTGGTLVTMMAVAEARDPLAWNLLQKSGMATRTGKSHSAKWELTSQGTRVLTSFNAAFSQGPHVLEELIASDTEIRTLLQTIAEAR